MNMGSDVGHLNMYFTEEEPPTEVLGNKRHWWGKPGPKAMNNLGNKFSNPMGMMGENEGQEVRREDALLRNPECLAILKTIAQSQKDLKGQLDAQFRSLDANN